MSRSKSHPIRKFTIFNTPGNVVPGVKKNIIIITIIIIFIIIIFIPLDQPGVI